ncbi:MAG: DUF6702 family protein [Pseudomonadota bacterium]
MRARRASACCCLLATLLVCAPSSTAHPLRLSLCEIEYSAERETLSISLRLFLTDVNEALVFDPHSTELRFAEPNEAPNAERLLLDYLNEFFGVKANDTPVALAISGKALSGEGDNRALAVSFEHRQAPPLRTLDIRNAVFTDLFFDQNNVVYVHVDSDSRSLMLSKKTPSHRLEF